MPLIHTKTQEEYDYVLKKIERDMPDMRWNTGQKPTELNFWGRYIVLGV